ncbi:DEAD/DEAH box helicase family protein [Streptomyces sp. NPDC051041]|uniref:DEAD/DEAH box helicase family protein n=1 Tax=Streptomyces sp. NPDC051041 TaxID=3365640 RepID=UPI0037B8E76C
MTVLEPPRPGRPRAVLFPDQAEAVEQLVRHLHRPGTRGLFVSATGTGKTLVSIRVADRLGARLVLFVVPTLDLAAQTALAWRRDGHDEHMVIVSSLDAARVGSTSDPLALAAAISVVGEGPDQLRALTVICTYDSLDKIEQTQRTGYAVPPFDLWRSWTRPTGPPAAPTRSGRSSMTRSAPAPTAAWRSRLAAAAGYLRTHGHLAAPGTNPPRPRPPHLRTDRPAPGTLPPPRRPRPHRPRDHPRRWRNHQDRRLARQSPHQAPHRPAPRDPCPPGRHALRRRLDHRGRRPRRPGLSTRCPQRGVTLMALFESGRPVLGVISYLLGGSPHSYGTRPADGRREAGGAAGGARLPRTVRGLPEFRADAARGRRRRTPRPRVAPGSRTGW